MVKVGQKLTKALKMLYTLVDFHLVYTGFQMLLEGPEFENLPLNQQIAPQYLPIWGEAEDFK